MIMDNATTLALQTSPFPSENLCPDQSFNPYFGKFGVPEIIEVTFLSFFSIFGTFGNLLVISSIIFSKTVFKRGNAFIINLALADLIVCSFFLPTVIATVIKTENALSEPVCQFAGYVVTVTCACSVCNLAFIAFCRYWFAVKSKSYKRVFSRRNVIMMVIFTWLWSNFIVSPTLFGWSSLVYDNKMAECGWDDCASKTYNILLMVAAIFLPVAVIIFSYCNLFVSVKQRFQTMRKRCSVVSRGEVISSNNNVHLKREICLLKTLGITIVMFLLCWTPYGVIVMFFTDTVPPQVKKAAARLGLSNSAMNFIVYGVMNPVFRQGYSKFLKYLFCRRRRRRQQQQNSP